MYSRTERLARGTVAAAVATFVAALSHTIGGGAFPPLALLALAAVVSVGWCTAVVGRGFSWPRVSAAVLASQALFHGTFSLVGSASVHVASPPSGNTVHATHAGLTTLAVVPDGTGHGHPGDAMLLAHLGAAVVTIVALRLGDRSSLGIAVLARLLDSVTRLTAPAPVLVASHPTRIRPDGSGFRPSRAAVLLGGLRRRGPPPLVTAA